jgi:hypothetical protein
VTTAGDAGSVTCGRSAIANSTNASIAPSVFTAFNCTLFAVASEPELIATRPSRTLAKVFEDFVFGQVPHVGLAALSLSQFLFSPILRFSSVYAHP